ncbi:Transcriptional activator [Dimargaris verticillata]|uniref:Transcriptional activator HAP2 n=1 Tax=Dimargaris verticillata TaxID=2761393 RepID=A0A9W8EE09_9FUNG|nr:Transcriptional activator [Dimargaris verticillata]
MLNIETGGYNMHQQGHAHHAYDRTDDQYGVPQTSSYLNGLVSSDHSRNSAAAVHLGYNQPQTMAAGTVPYGQQSQYSNMPLMSSQSHPLMLSSPTIPSHPIPPQSATGTGAAPTAIHAVNEESEEPMYVNAKQYHRILKRRQARAQLEAKHKISKQRKKFLHQSRHLHAMRRPRGPGGRFLTAAEVAKLEEEERAHGNGQSGEGTNGNGPSAH